MTTNTPFSQFPVLNQLFQRPDPGQNRNMIADILQRVFPHAGAGQTPPVPPTGSQPPPGPGGLFGQQGPFGALGNYLQHPSRDTLDAMFPQALVDIGHNVFPGGTPPPQGQQQFPWLRRLMPQQPTGSPGPGPGGTGSAGNGPFSF